jgi:membrane associated rhomboid family serine protease
VSDPQQVAQVPTCYRHPERETWIRCARCDRPICPDCMTEAAVGFQCPECVAAGRAAVRPARSVLGGRLDVRAGVVTYSLMGICLVLYGLNLLFSWTGGPDLRVELGVVGIGVTNGAGGPELVGVAAGDWYRLLTAQFVHGGVLHLLFNMYVLYIVGPGLEQALGRLRYLVLFLLSGFTGAVASYLFNDPRVLSVGASGAIFGLLGAVLVVQHRLGRQTTEIIGLLVHNLVLGFVLPNIDWRAHLGGLIAGSLLAAAIAFPPAKLRAQVFIVACLALLAVDLLLVSARTADIRDTTGVPITAAERAGDA